MTAGEDRTCGICPLAHRCHLALDEAVAAPNPSKMGGLLLRPRTRRLAEWAAAHLEPSESSAWLFKVTGRNCLDELDQLLTGLGSLGSAGFDAALIDRDGVYAPWTHAPLPRLLDQLRSAWFPPMLASEGLTFDFQPIVNALDADIMGFEALARARVGEHVVDARALLHIARAHAMLQEFDDLTREMGIRVGAPIAAAQRALFINVAPIAERAPGEVVRSTFAAIDRTGLDPRHFVLEFDAGGVIAELGRMSTLLESYVELGIAVSLDDFGAEPRSVDALPALRPRHVKLSPRLVQASIEFGETGLVRALVRRAHEAGATVIAKHVETKEQADVLRSLGCDALQGWFVGKPDALTLARVA